MTSKNSKIIIIEWFRTYIYNMSNTKCFYFSFRNALVQWAEDPVAPLRIAKLRRSSENRRVSLSIVLRGNRPAAFCLRAAREGNKKRLGPSPVPKVVARRAGGLSRRAGEWGHDSRGGWNIGDTRGFQWGYMWRHRPVTGQVLGSRGVD